jgi:hypothetical protein
LHPLLMSSPTRAHLSRINGSSCSWPVFTAPQRVSPQTHKTHMHSCQSSPTSPLDGAASARCTIP